MSMLSSPSDFDPRILVNEPLMFLNWYNNPDVVIHRQPRKVIPLSNRIRRTHGRVHLPLTNEQILSIKTHYYLEWQLLTITTVAIVICYFLFNPLLLFYVRFESSTSLDAQYACLLFIVFYGSAIVSIIFWMIISRLSIWHSNFNTAPQFIEESQTNNNNNNNNLSTQIDTQSPQGTTTANQRTKKRKKQKKKDKAESDSDEASDNDENDTTAQAPMDDRKEQEFINEQTQKLKQGGFAGNGGNVNDNGLTTATSRVTGLILSLRWSLFGFALAMGIFSACNSYAQLLMASALAGAFFPALLISSSNVLVYQMKRLPSVQFDLRLINYIIMFGWIFLPLITGIIGEYAAYRWPFVFGCVTLLVFLAASMFLHPGQPTISMIADSQNESLNDELSDDNNSVGLNASVTGQSSAGGGMFDDTTPLRTVPETTGYDDDDDTSSVTSDASSIFRMPGDHDAPTNAMETVDEINGRPVRGAQATANQRVRYANELKRAGLDANIIPEEDDGGRPHCGCFDNAIMKNSCEYNNRLMSSSMGVFQIGTFLLLIQSFCVDLCVACYLTWYPIVMYDHFGQRFVYSGIQMMLTGAAVVFFATWVARRNTTQFFLYSINIFASFFIILLSICMIEFGDVLFYWLIFPFIMGCIVLIGMISRMMLSRITPNGCLSFINGSTQIFHLAAYGIGPLILGIIDGFDESESDYYFWSLIYCLMAIHAFSSLGLYMTQVIFTAIKIWGLSTYQNRP